VYQKSGGPDGLVLFRHEGGGFTDWRVKDSSVLDDCNGASFYIISALSHQPGPPGVLAYSMGTNRNGEGNDGWIDFGANPACNAHCGIADTAGVR
jgi:hypothetical protein